MFVSVALRLCGRFYRLIIIGELRLHSGEPCIGILYTFQLYAKVRFQYQFEGNFGPSVKQSDKKIKVAVKIQDDCQFPALCRIMPHNFCTIEHKIVILVHIHTFACMNN